MKNIPVDKEKLDEALANVPEGTPIFMMNLIRFAAEYSDSENSFRSGMQAYMEGYIPAFNKIAGNFPGIKPFFVGSALASLVAPANEKWDVAALIEYPSLAVFKQLIEHPDYAVTAEPYRLASIEDWRLIVTVKMNVG